MSDVCALASSAGGAFLLLGCRDGLRGYHLDVGKSPRKLIPAAGEASTVQSCRKVDGIPGVVAVLGETPLIAFVLSCGGVTGSWRSDNMGEGRGGEEGRVMTTPRALQLYDVCADEVIATASFEAAVVGVRMNSELLVVILEDCVHVMDLATLQHLAKLSTTKPRNPSGLVQLSEPTMDPRGEPVTYLAYPQSDNGLGDVWVAQVCGKRLGGKVEPNTEPHGGRSPSVERVAIVQAHRGPIVCLAMTRDGSRLATASSRGTTVKVFEIPSARLLFVFRRGVTKARIHSLAFDSTGRSNGRQLAALSSRGTLHVFRCGSADCDELSEQPACPAASADGGAELRSFAQATVTQNSGRGNSSNSFSTTGGCIKHCGLQSCFFSGDGQFVWVVVPQFFGSWCSGVELPDDIEGSTGCGGGVAREDRRVRDGLYWVLQLYAIRTRGCELVKRYLLG